MRCPSSPLVIHSCPDGSMCSPDTIAGSSRVRSKHIDDQLPLASRKEMRPIWLWRPVVPKSVSQRRPSMDLHIKKVWLPGAASCLLFFGFYWVLIWLPFDKNRFQFLAIPYLVLPFVGALAAYWSRRMKGSVLERIVSALFPVFAFVALFAVRIVYGLFFEGKLYTLPHFLAGFSVTLVFIVVGGLLLVLGAWPFCRPHLREQLP